MVSNSRGRNHTKVVTALGSNHIKCHTEILAKGWETIVLVSSPVRYVYVHKFAGMPATCMYVNVLVGQVGLHVHVRRPYVKAFVVRPTCTYVILCL